MNLIKIQFFYLLFCLTFVSACSAGNAGTLEENFDPEDTFDTANAKNTASASAVDPTKEEFLKTQNLSLEELKKQAKVYTFEDFKSLTDEELSKEFYGIENTAVFWFKDFKQWKLEELDYMQIRSLAHLFHFHNRRLNGDDTRYNMFAEPGSYDKTYIDNDGKIFNITLEQLKIATTKIDNESSDLCFGSFTNETNYHPVEHIQQLNANQLRVFYDCLSEEQLFALTNEQIIGSEIFHTTGRIVPFSPERLKSFGDGLEKMRCWAFQKLNQNQISGLTSKQIGWARIRSHWHGDLEWCWSPEQIAWLTPNQISGLLINDRTRLHRVHIEALNDEQLKGFSKDQILHIPRQYIRLFSPHQLRVLLENNTANYFVKRVIDFQDEGPDIFDGYLDDLSSSHPELATHIYSLLPEQFASLRLEQALNLHFEMPFGLTPDQISHFPNFVKILNFSDYKWEYYRIKNGIEGHPRIKQYNLAEAIANYERVLRSKYNTLNHAKLLNREQVRAIPPEQIPDFPPEGLKTLYERNFDQEEYDILEYERITPPYMRGFDKYDRKENKKYIVGLGEEYEGQYEIPLTLDQFEQITLEQFNFIFNDHTWYLKRRHLPDKYLNTLNLEKTNILLNLSKKSDSTWPGSISSMTKRLLERKSQIQ